MGGNLGQNLTVFILLGGVFIFVISMIIHGRRLERKDKEMQDNKKV